MIKMPINKSELISEIAPLLKNLGYKKRNNTWVLYLKDLDVVFNVQGSQFDTEMYYINLGIYIHELGEKKNPSISSCQIVERVNQEFNNVNLIINVINKWIEWYGDLNLLRSKALENKLPKCTHKNVYGYLLYKSF
ncbi:MAG: DUF4304 domain-containing protein [Oscillospiraceae bacterium]|nr:DUF4304 domain-containing protein [Oscillospiraceae bacterium]